MPRIATDFAQFLRLPRDAPPQSSVGRCDRAKDKACQKTSENASLTGRWRVFPLAG